MTDDTIQAFGDSMEKTILAPMRSYLSALADHAEALTRIQVEAAKAYTELTFRELRGVTYIRDAEGFRAYVGNGPELARAFSERLKSDTDKLTKADQTFMENTQKLAQESVGKSPKGRRGRRPEPPAGGGDLLASSVVGSIPSGRRRVMTPGGGCFLGWRPGA